MATVYSLRIASPTLHDIPALPHLELKTHPNIQPFRASHTDAQNVKYITALETEHSRDLYLQGAMAVGQIARLLEELCVEIYDGDGDVDDVDDDDDDGEENDKYDWEEMVAVEELPTCQHPSDVIVIHQFVSHEKRDQISAWARGVSPANDISINRGLARPRCDADIIDLENPDAIYLRGAFVVGDIAGLLEELVRGLDNKTDVSEEEDCEKKSFAAFSPNQVALAQLPVEPFSSLRNLDEIPYTDFASRLSCLSARLAKLELDINIFSQDRSDALKQMELDDSSAVAAAPESNIKYWSGCSEIVDGDCHGHMECPADALGICDILESEDSLLLGRIWTMTNTTTTGFSLETPWESDVQPVNFESGKDYFCSLD